MSWGVCFPPPLRFGPRCSTGYTETGDCRAAPTLPACRGTQATRGSSFESDKEHPQ